MKQKIASVISAVILCLVSFSFTSCITKDSSVYGEKEVLNYVDEICKEPLNFWKQNWLQKILMT